MSLSDLRYIPVESEEELNSLLRRLGWIYTYFNADRGLHVEQHRSLDKILSTAPIHRSESVSELEHAEQALPERFSVPANGARFLSVPSEEIELRAFIARAGTQGWIVCQNGAVVHEEYLGGHESTTRWMTNSASKLVVAMLTAIAVEEGSLKSYQDPLITYCPELAGSGWDGVTIEQCLRMTTGADWTEEDLDLMRDCPFVRFFYAVAFGSIGEFVAGLGRRFEPGTQLQYSSMDTEALGTALMRATGKGIAPYLEEKIWQPAGMESDAYWVTDATGREMALSGLCATLRDYARLGLLLADGGRSHGRQIVPESFVASLSEPDPATFELEGHDDYPLVCWNQAFISCDATQSEGDYMAAGSYGQLIYVDPARSVVIAHQGVYPDIETEYVEMYRHLFMFRAVARYISSD